MRKKLRRACERVNAYCNWIAIFVEMGAIGVVIWGSCLESLYCADRYSWIITFGALVAMAGGFIQKKLPWAYTRLARKHKEENK